MKPVQQQYSTVLYASAALIIRSLKSVIKVVLSKRGLRGPKKADPGVKIHISPRVCRNSEASMRHKVLMSLATTLS